MKEVDYQNERADTINETTAMAHETTLLNPRFYTCLLYTSPSPRDS